MWSEWLARTLGRRRDEEAGEPVVTPQLGPRHDAPPELSADGLNPGADDYRSSLPTLEEAE
jgi:hypothetical protein